MCDTNPMQYLPLFLLMMAVLIAAYFYLERAKVRDGNRPSATKTTTTEVESAPPATERPAE